MSLFFDAQYLPDRCWVRRHARHLLRVTADAPPYFRYRYRQDRAIRLRCFILFLLLHYGGGRSVPCARQRVKLKKHVRCRRTNGGKPTRTNNQRHKRCEPELNQPNQTNETTTNEIVTVNDNKQQRWSIAKRLLWTNDEVNRRNNNEGSQRGSKRARGTTKTGNANVQRNRRSTTTTTQTTITNEDQQQQQT